MAEKGLTPRVLLGWIMFVVPVFVVLFTWLYVATALSDLQSLWIAWSLMLTVWVIARGLWMVRNG